MDEEIMYATIYSDTNDVEGFIFEGYLGSPYVFRANGADHSPKFRLGGRPIGFKVGEGLGGTGSNDQPLELAIVYNSCNCPASQFMTEIAAPEDMVTWAVSGPDDSKTLQYYDNYMENIYDQNCGTYSVVLEPAYSFLTVSRTGSVSTSTHAHPYDDLITLSSSDVNDIGKYSVTMRITQIPGVDGYAHPYAGTMPDMTKEFSVTINPCLETLTTGTAIPDFTYTIGQPSITKPYTWNQACGYNVDVQITNLPGFAEHDRDAQEITVDFIQDRAVAGPYTVTITATVLEPTDHTFTAYNTIQETYDFTITMEDPCENTVMKNPTAADMATSVFGVLDEMNILEGTDTVSENHGDGMGLTYCGSRVFSIVSVTPSSPAYAGFL